MRKSTKSLYWTGFVVLAMWGLGCSTEPSGGCSKDSDCKGSRVCENGVCVAGGAGGAGTTSLVGGGGGSPATCDNQGDCVACFDCAGAGTCSPEINACANSADCTGLLDCLNACDPADDLCMGDCYNIYPQSAIDAAINARVCLECACSNDCGTCSG